MSTIFKLKHLYKKTFFRITKKDPISNSYINSKIPKIRLGDISASWVIPNNIINEFSVCYLFGAGENISFDLEIVKYYNSEVNIFDPTPRAIEYYKKLRANPLNNSIKFEKINYFEFGVWSENTALKFYAPQNKNHVSHSLLNLQKTTDYFEAQVYTLDTIIKKLNHNNIDLIKLDIEGAEYEVIKSMILHKIYPKILCVEFDEVFSPIDSNYEDRIREILNNLSEIGYKIFHLDYPGNYTLIRNK